MSTNELHERIYAPYGFESARGLRVSPAQPMMLSGQAATAGVGLHQRPPSSTVAVVPAQLVEKADRMFASAAASAFVGGPPDWPGGRLGVRGYRAGASRRTTPSLPNGVPLMLPRT